MWLVYDSIRQALYGTHTYRVISIFWALFSQLWHYAVLGALVAAMASRFLPRERLRDLLRARRGWSLIGAALVGLVSPLSTYAAIPLVGSLMLVGVPAPPLLAFLVASPLMNPSLFLITWGVIGPEMALARAVSAFLLGMVAGGLTEVLSKRGMDFGRDMRVKGDRREGGRPGAIGFLHEFGRSLSYVGRYFLLSLFLAALVQVLVPPRWITWLFGGRGFTSAAMGGLLGVPLYSCGGGTVPVIATLVSMGMGQGAALAFFLTGPATKPATILSLQAVARGKVLALYLGVTLIGGVLLGYTYSLFAPELHLDDLYYGQVEPAEDALFTKPGIGGPAKIW